MDACGPLLAANQALADVCVSPVARVCACVQVLLPIAHEFAPDIILISAGFDAAAGDPIGGCNLTPECFGAMTAALMPVAPTVLLLEGGYNLRSTALATEACLRVLLGEPAPELQHGSPSPYAWFSLESTRKAHSRFWPCLQGAGRPALQVRLPAGWGAAAAGGDGQQHGEGSDLELQYEDEYEEAEYESDGQEEVQEGDGAEEEEDEEQGSDEAAGADAVGAAAGGEAAPGYPGHHQQPQQQRRQAGVKLGIKRSAELQGADDDAGGGVDAGRRVRSAAAATGGLPPYVQRAAAASQQQHSSSHARPLLRNGSSVSASSGSLASSSSGGGSRQGGAGRVLVSRKQEMLKAIHKRAMQLFLRKQRQLSAAKQQGQQPVQQQQEQ